MVLFIAGYWAVCCIITIARLPDPFYRPDWIFQPYTARLFSLRNPQLLPQEQDFKVLFVPGHTHYRGEIQHKFLNKQYHAKEHRALDFLSSYQTKPCKLISLAGFFQPLCFSFEEIDVPRRLIFGHYRPFA